ncbi:hypothetical protein F4774DRAFT_427998 [Daldinia eschscholtzii]|nr:hypothetical protein F4774DRAFT_427998 [Daldinia eschscholtzii]
MTDRNKLPEASPALSTYQQIQARVASSARQLTQTGAALSARPSGQPELTCGSSGRATTSRFTDRLRMMLPSSSDDDITDDREDRRSTRRRYEDSSDSSSSSSYDSSSSSSSISSRPRRKHKRRLRSKSHHRRSKSRKSTKRPTSRDRSKHHKSSRSHKYSKSDKPHKSRGFKRKRGGESSEEDDYSGAVAQVTPTLRNAFREEIKDDFESFNSGRKWMMSNKPAIHEDRFKEMVPKPYFDEEFTQDDYEAVVRRWDADPAKPLILGLHTQKNLIETGRAPPKKPRRGERDSFGIVYRMFPRYYGCTYEEFMGPKYQLEYDYSDNQMVTLENGVKDHDPFPSKPFSENLRCLAAQNIWLENLDLLATCIQYVNRVRTNDTRPWKLVDCDQESMFFKVWQTVINKNLGRQEMGVLYSQVKQQLGPKPGFYQTFFDQINQSVTAILPRVQKSEFHASKRRSNNDPYFILTVDLAILIHALDNVSCWGIPLLRDAKSSAKLIQQATPGHDYPSDKKFSKARESSIVAHRALNRAAELRAKARAGRGPLISLEDDDVDLSNRSPIKTSRNLSLLNLLSHSS